MREPTNETVRIQTIGVFMTKETIKHRKEEKKKPMLSPKEKKAKKMEKKQAKQGK
jgi:hypothetical protein